MDIVARCHGFQPSVTATPLRHCHRMTAAMVVLTGRVTRVGLSRWAGNGGSDRTVQRFFATGLPWAPLCWVCFPHQGDRPAETSLVGGEEVVATKAGTHPQGLARFLASLDGTPVPGVACFTLSLGRVQARRSWPIRVEHGVRSDAAHAASKAQAAAQKPTAPGAQRRPGRPKGRQHTPTADGTFTPECWRLPSGRAALRHRLAGGGSLPSWGLEGHWGNPHAWPRARPRPRHLMAKRRDDAAWSCPSTGS
jgi:hypothetical protein